MLLRRLDFAATGPQARAILRRRRASRNSCGDPMTAGNRTRRHDPAWLNLGEGMTARRQSHPRLQGVA